MTKEIGERTQVVTKVKELTTGVPAALAASGQAYTVGLLEIGKMLGGFGREVFAEAGRHGKATFRARNLRELAELQAAFAQHRLEISTAHAKELADLAHDQARHMIAPLVTLLRPEKTA